MLNDNAVIVFLSETDLLSVLKLNLDYGDVINYSDCTILKKCKILELIELSVLIRTSTKLKVLKESISNTFFTYKTYISSVTFQL